MASSSASTSKKTFPNALMSSCKERMVSVSMYFWHTAQSCAAFFLRFPLFFFNMKFLPEVVQLFVLMITAPLMFSYAVMMFLWSKFKTRSLLRTERMRPSNVLITGSSKGLGRALAIKYADEGAKFIAIQGRDKEELQQVKKICEERGAEVEFAVLDTRDAENMNKWISVVNTRHPLDLVIANAGTTPGFIKQCSKEEDTLENFDHCMRELFDINLNGTLNTILPTLKLMKRRSEVEVTYSGQVAIVSSMLSWSSTGSYSATKVCLRNMAESLRPLMARHNITVNAVCPGLISTRLTSKKNPNAFTMSPTMAADIVFHGLLEDKPMVSFPFVSHIAAWMVDILPFSLKEPIYNFLDIVRYTEEVHF